MIFTGNLLENNYFSNVFFADILIRLNNKERNKNDCKKKLKIFAKKLIYLVDNLITIVLYSYCKYVIIPVKLQESANETGGGGISGESRKSAEGAR